MENQNHKYSTVIIGCTIIFIGLIFLLNSTGILSWYIWLYFFKFWPLFLIFLGIKLIFSNSKIINIVLFILAVLLLVVIGIYAYSGLDSNGYRIMKGRDSICGAGRCMRNDLFYYNK